LTFSSNVLYSERYPYRSSHRWNHGSINSNQDPRVFDTTKDLLQHQFEQRLFRLYFHLFCANPVIPAVTVEVGCTRDFTLQGIIPTFTESELPRVWYKPIFRGVFFEMRYPFEVSSY
jgi:hypothetical protein